MKLKRAKELAKEWRRQNNAWAGGLNPTLSESAIGMIILDDHITKLEEEQDELKAKIESLTLKRRRRSVCWR